MKVENSDFGRNKLKELSPLFDAIEGNEIERVGQLLKNGANPNAIDDWQTPLHRASHFGNKENMEQLIKYGADVNLKDIDGGYTPIFNAISTRDKDVVEILIKNGADLTINSNDDRTTLDMASKYSKEIKEYITPIYNEQFAYKFAAKLQAELPKQEDLNNSNFISDFRASIDHSKLEALHAEIQRRNKSVDIPETYISETVNQKETIKESQSIIQEVEPTQQPQRPIRKLKL